MKFRPKRRIRSLRCRDECTKPASHGPSALRALTSGALALTGMAGNALADSPIDRWEGEYNYSFYQEDDLDASKVATGLDTARYEIEMHQFSFRAPVSDRWDVAFEIVSETMSGASPWYVVPDVAGGGDPIQVTTGASIDDERTDVLVSANRYYDNARMGFSTGFSTEDDYQAINLGIDGETHFNEKNTTLSAGLGLSFDEIDTTPGLTVPVSDNKESVSLFLGLGQVLSRQSSFQSSLSYKYNTGFLADPYKLTHITGGGGNIPEVRPDNRHQLAWLNRFRYHMLELGGSLHIDYQFYFDTWDISSHTIDLAWHQYFWERFKVIPSLRYYSQSAAEFYTPFLTAAPAAGADYSSDYRLAAYGALSFGIAGEWHFQTGWTGDRDWVLRLGWDRYFSSEDLSHDDSVVEIPGLVDYSVGTVGLKMTF